MRGAVWRRRNTPASPRPKAQPSLLSPPFMPPHPTPTPIAPFGEPSGPEARTRVHTLGAGRAPSPLGSGKTRGKGTHLPWQVQGQMRCCRWKAGNQAEMGVVVIFIITASDNWLDCIFLQLPLGPCRNSSRRCWKLLRTHIRRSGFCLSSHLPCEVLWAGSSPCPSLTLHPRPPLLSGPRRVAEMPGLGLWSSVNGRSWLCGVWGGCPGTTGEAKAGRGGSLAPSPLPQPWAPEPVGFLGLTGDTSESLPPFHNRVGKESWPSLRSRHGDQPQRGVQRVGAGLVQEAARQGKLGDRAASSQALGPWLKGAGETECAHRHLGPKEGSAATARLQGSLCLLPPSQERPLCAISVLGPGNRVQCQPGPPSLPSLTLGSADPGMRLLWSPVPAFSPADCVIPGKRLNLSEPIFSSM